MQVLLELLRNNANAKVLVGLPKTGGAGREVITSYALEEIPLGGEAVYGTPTMEAYSALAGAANAAMNALGAAAGSLALSGSGLAVPNRQLKTIQSTISTWTDCQKMVLRLNLQFFALEKGDDVRVPVKRLLKCVYPIFENDIPGMVKAPNEYNFTGEKCVSLRIGKWFYAPPLFLIRNANFHLSKETITGGNPLYAKGSIQMEAFRMLSADEVGNFLVGAADSGGDVKEDVT